MNFRVFAEEFFSYLIPGSFLMLVGLASAQVSTSIRPGWLLNEPWRWVTVAALILVGYFLGHFAQMVGNLVVREPDEKAVSTDGVQGLEYPRRFFRAENTEVTEEFKLAVLSRIEDRHGFRPAGLQSNSKEAYRSAHSEVLGLAKAAVLQSDYDHDVRRLDALYGMYGGLYGVLPLSAIVFGLFALKEMLDPFQFLSSYLDGHRNLWLLLMFVGLLLVVVGLGMPITRRRYHLFTHKYVEQVYVDFLEVSCRSKSGSPITSPRMVTMTASAPSPELSPKP